MVMAHGSSDAEPSLMEPPAGQNDADFEMIEAAVMETARALVSGRIFALLQRAGRRPNLKRDR
jgi:hypothetical protein